MDSNDHRRWILGFVRQPKGSKGSLHNHNVHASSHLLTKTQEDIQSAAVVNTSLIGVRPVCQHNFRNNRMLKELRIMLE